MSFECLSRSQYYTDKELFEIQRSAVPKHVAIIPDGNRRWAHQQSGFIATNGHWAGASIVTTILEAASDIGVDVLTVYSFSTENWRRPPHEVQTLMSIFETFLRENRQKMLDMGVRFGTIGDLTPFPQAVKDEIALTREATSKGEEIDLVLAMNYGARDEMKRAIRAMVEAVEEGKLRKEEITEEVVSHYLDTGPYGDPELLIRTSGEKRFSNFLLWQLAYTEIHVTETLWPDFTPRDLLEAVLDFQKRKRRLGR